MSKSRSTKEIDSGCNSCFLPCTKPIAVFDHLFISFSHVCIAIKTLYIFKVTKNNSSCFKCAVSCLTKVANYSELVDRRIRLSVDQKYASSSAVVDFQFFGNQSFFS